MSIQALSEYTRVSKYAHYLPAKKRKETWYEMNDRVVDMHKTKYSDKLDLLKDDLDFVTKKLKDKTILGSQRALQFGGPGILKKEARLFNCVAGYCDRTRFFAEYFWLLLCGCGATLSVQQQHIANLPQLISKNVRRSSVSFRIPDSIEGWADSVHALIASYMEEESDYRHMEVSFDYSLIRPAGSNLSWGGKAPGPNGLQNTHKKVRDILEKAVQDGQEKLRPIQAYDIAMHIADAVLSGGIRRSATLCMFSYDDEEMMTAKTGNWFAENPQRARSNNSVVLLRNTTSFDDFQSIIKHVKMWGEPGFIWVDDLDSLYNPCITKDSIIDTTNGPKLVADLIDKPFTAVVDGQNYEATGFWYSGHKEVYQVQAENGRFVKATANHKFLIERKKERLWIEVKDIIVGEDKIVVNDIIQHREQNYLEPLVSIVTSIESVGFEDVYDCTVDGVHCFSANGIIVHNCCEISLYGYLDPETKKSSGWQACNLSEINATKIETEEDFLEACKAAAIIGTLQAGYTNFDYLTDISREITKREALLGVSITGIMEKPSIILNPELQKQGAQLILETNKRIAKILGINPCARATCVKPSGTASCLLGTSSGIHPHHAKRYIRRVQANKHENTLKFFSMYNPTAVEESVWSANKTDMVISFLCEVPKGSITKNQMGALDLLKAVLLTQKNWIEYGTDLSLCVKPWLRHNVSNTITVADNEWDDVTQFIYDNRQWFACISLLSITGDRDYPQAPFTRVFTPREIFDEYGDGSLFAYHLLEESKELFGNDLWKACSYVLFPDKNTNTTLFRSDYRHFYDEVQEFANQYFEGDIQKTTYLLKDLYNWQTWKHLKESYQDVDWANYNETELDTMPMFQAGDACGGGACDMGDLGAAIRESIRS